jgi:hypothetical protein
MPHPPPPLRHHHCNPLPQTAAPHCILSSWSPPHPSMSLIVSSEFLWDTDFGAAFDFSDKFGTNFGVAFFFDSAFSDSSSSSGSFQSNNVEQNMQLCRHRPCRQRQPNQCFSIVSVKKSCWYQNFTKTGMMPNLTHKLSSFDRYGKFCHWFRMPLAKAEVLMDILINHKYIDPPRLHCRRSKF